MLDKEMKKEIQKDAFSKERNQAFAKADELANKFEKERWPVMTVEQVINFLMSVQKITGHFPVANTSISEPGVMDSLFKRPSIGRIPRLFV